MTTRVEDGSLERFREEARAIHQRAGWHLFTLLASAALLVSSVFVVAAWWRTPDSPILWPNLGGFLACAATVVWTRRTRRVQAGIGVLATLMMFGICGVILVQRGSLAPALSYGLTTVAVVFIAGRWQLGWPLAVVLATWTTAVTALAASGRFVIDAPNPLGEVLARLLAMAVAVVLMAIAARIALRRRGDIDALLERALSLTEAERDEARRLAARRAQAVTEIGHEIRTPMTGIVGTAQLLSQQPMTPLQRQLISTQRQSAERLMQLVTAVLEEAKVDAAQALAGRAPVDLRQLVAEAADLYGAQAQRKGIELIWTAEPGFPRFVVGDAMRTRQIVANLVSNAVKYTDRGSVEIRLRRRGSDALLVEVHDSGRGVAAQRLEAIFERFVGDATGDAQAPSTGLGLAISRELAHALGGRVDVASRVGVGSCFTLELPCVVAPPPAGEEPASARALAGRLWVVGASPPLATQLRYLLGEMKIEGCFVDRLPDVSERNTGSAGPQAVLIDVWVGHGAGIDHLPRAMQAARSGRWRVIVVSGLAEDTSVAIPVDACQIFRPLRLSSLHEALVWAFDVPGGSGNRPLAMPAVRVLLVDDNAINQLVGKAMLDAMGAEVVVADDGAAAVDAAAARDFDIILMDLQMPVLDGLEATRRLRANEQRSGRARTPVVAVTGMSPSEVATGFESTGIDAVLLKPYTIDQLRGVLARYVGGPSTQPAAAPVSGPAPRGA